jgi:hypothetical protein
MVFLGNDKRCPHQLKKVKVHRVNTKSPFVVSFPPDNVLQGSIGDPPAINPSLSQADGYFAKLEPKKPGTYTLATFGEVVIDKESVFALEVIYTIEVVAAQ